MRRLRLSACARVCIRVICNTCFVSFPRQQLLVQRVSRPGWSGVSERSAAEVPGGPQEPRPHHGESWVRVKLQTLVYDILPSTTAVFSYAIGSRKLSANERFCCCCCCWWWWCSDSSKCVTNNSDYISRLFDKYVA